MGTLKVINHEKQGEALFQISPSFKFKGQDIHHIVIMNVNGNLLKAMPAHSDGTIVSKGWYYTMPGVTVESLHKLVIKLKNLNNHLISQKTISQSA